MGIAFLWLKYNLNYTKARALRVTVLLGYVEITITVYSISQYIAFVNGFVLYIGFDANDIFNWVMKFRRIHKDNSPPA